MWQPPVCSGTVEQMKRISLDEIEKKLNAASYEQLCRLIYGQVENGRLKPVKASGINGKKPALYTQYWIVDQTQKPDYRMYEDELKFGLSTRISTDYYLRHLDQYAKDRKWVLQLSDYFLHTQEQNTVEPVSKNERSFQIWGREKFLQHEQGKKILKRCGVDASWLSFYETSEPLAFYSSHRQTPQNLLILENKDTFYSMRRYLLEQGRDAKILGVSFGTLIYGAGKGILRSFQDFSFCVEPYMRAPQNRIYYFGDLDYEGIGIYERLAKTFEPEIRQENIRPFIQAYETMLIKARTVWELPLTKEKQNRDLSGRFFACFPDATICRMQEVLESGHYIPQEILTSNDFSQEAACNTNF